MILRKRRPCCGGIAVHLQRFCAALPAAGKRRVWGRRLAAGLAIALCGCAVGPDFQRPLLEAPLERLNTPNGPALPSQVSEQAPDAEWWALFNDATLNVLLRRAQDGNLELRAAAARIEQSRAQRGLARAAGLPRLGVGGSYAREALSGNGPMARLGARDNAHDLWQAGFDASWELDLWGRNQRSREAAAAGALAAVYQREGVRVSMAADIARNYLLLRGVQTQLRIAEQHSQLVEQLARLTQRRAAAGAATTAETASAGAELATVQATLPLLRQQQAALTNALALLLGEPPRALNAELAVRSELPALPRQIAVGLPSELARRRPDILQAEAQLHAATAAIGVAQADFYPRIRLNGSLGLQAFEAEDFGNWSSRNFSVGPSLYLPIFEGGRLRRMLELSQAQQQQAAIQYQQTVLRAWHEVDNALYGYASVQWRQQRVEQAFQQQRQAYAAAARRYQQGASDYLGVLIAQQKLFARQRELSDSRTAMALAMVSLYKTLGGGWDAAASQGAEP